MKKIFSKFNRKNKLKFQTETSIFIENGKKFAIKKPLTAEAKEHINNIYSNYLLLKESFSDVKNVKVVDAKLLEDSSIIFEYVEGQGLDKVLSNLVVKKNKKQVFEFFLAYLEFIKKLSPVFITNFEIDPKYKEVFGDFKIENIECSNVYNIDLIFDNIIVQDGNNYCIIDYEWVFHQTMPINYILYRTICNSFYKYPTLLCEIISSEELCDFLGITKNEQEIYLEMEHNLQAYVLGQDYDYVIQSRYLKKHTSLKELLNSKKRYTLKQVLKKPRLLFKRGD